MQQFRGLSARAPYFSNGSAKILPRWSTSMTAGFQITSAHQEKQDLINFMSVL